MNFTKTKVVICLFPSKTGGRQSYILKEYSPNAVFGFDIKELSELWDNNYFKYLKEDNNKVKNIGIKLLIGKKELYPGEVSKADMLINDSGKDYLGPRLLSSGSAFLIREGSKIIGTGKIL